MDNYQILRELIWLILLEKDKEVRIRYADRALKEIDKIKQETASKEIAIDRLTQKLAETSKTIQNSESWVQSLYSALGKDRNFYVRLALLKQKEGKE